MRNKKFLPSQTWLLLFVIGLLFVLATSLCFSRESFEKNKELVEGKTIIMEKDVSETDRFSRLLRYVYIDDVFINDYLVRQGFAYASSYPPDVKYQEQFRNAEREARENNRGLWGSC